MKPVRHKIGALVGLEQTPKQKGVKNQKGNYVAELGNLCCSDKKDGGDIFGLHVHDLLQRIGVLR